MIIEHLWIEANESYRTDLSEEHVNTFKAPHSHIVFFSMAKKCHCCWSRINKQEWSRRPTPQMWPHLSHHQRWPHHHLRSVSSGNDLQSPTQFSNGGREPQGVGLTAAAPHGEGDLGRVRPSWHHWGDTEAETAGGGEATWTDGF